MIKVFQRFGPMARAAFASALLAAILLVVTNSVGAYDALRERTFDVMLTRLASPPPPTTVMVVDIDRRSLDRLGAWPWSREQTARFLADVLAAGPKAVGVDILIDGPDERSAAALARRLGELTGSAAVRAMAAGLPDGDAAVSAAIRDKPVVLGLALDPERPGDQLPATPVLAQGPFDLSGIWEAAGIAGPPADVAKAAAGLGVLSLAGDADGRVRRVPLLALAADGIRPGLALEVARIASDASAYVLARGNELRMRELSFSLAPDATLRLLPPSEAAMAARTVAAWEVSTPAGRAALAGRVVLIGSSAPELGGLRLASGAALVPSVQRQASAVAQLLGGVQPRRPLSMDLHEGLAVVLAALAGWVAAHARGAMRGAGLAAAGLAAWWILCAMMLSGWQVLVDPIAAPVALVGSLAVSGSIVAAESRRREAALRRRFEQHLAPELVTRIAEDPSLLKLAGETREASILFTDVEGFTAMTERSDPATLIRVLDRYIDEMSAIIVAHGGMVEKIVGDGFHGLFNAPLDLALHADKAVACSQAIRAFSEAFAAEPEPRSLGFGRTRVGVETGPVIVGDVGGGTRLDYTAYGNAMNTAARLEAANKDLGSAICIGPGTAGRLTDRAVLRPLGKLDVRGRREAQEVYDLWPMAVTPAQRQRHLEAMSLADGDPARAAAALAALAGELPDDVALARLAARLRALAAC